MTERERWIVYPLLFLALGAALRDKLSEHTKTRSLECQELIVYGEDGPGQPPVPLVQIGGIKRSSAEQPHLGQIIVNGLVQANEIHAGGMQAQDIQASRVNADNYFFHRIPLSPVMRNMPGATPVDPAQLQQLQQPTQPPQTEADDDKAGDDKTGDDKAGDDKTGDDKASDGAAADEANDAKAPPAE